MKFEEIFNEVGLYTANSFTEGVAIKIEKGHIGTEMTFVHYKKADDLFPEPFNVKIYSELFKKEYTKVLTVNRLFNKKTF